MRLFLAIELSDDLRRHLVQLQDTLRTAVPGLSFTLPANLHLTLKFLGQVSDKQLKPLCDALSGIQRGGKFPLAAKTIVCFPPHGPVNIIAAGVTASPALLQLQTRVESACSACGFSRETRPFHAHVTLARAQSPVRTPLRREIVDLLIDRGSAPITVVREFVLMESRLSHAGPEYTPLARFNTILSF